LETFFTSKVSKVYFIPIFAAEMEKRNEILIKAGELFMRYGIKSVSMDDLAREIGISKKTIYTYFKDKNVLVETIVATKMYNIESDCCSLSAKSENAIQELFTIINLISESTGNIHPSVFYDMQKYHPGAQTLIEKHEKDYILPVILRNIERGRAEKLYRKDFDASIVAQIYITVNDSIFKRSIISQNELSVKQIFTESLHFMLFGMATVAGKEYIRKYLTNE
jgi:AcrR family transcriptional regulator